MKDGISGIIQREDVQKIRAMTLKVDEGEYYLLELGFYGDGTATDNLETGARRGAIAGALPAGAAAVGAGFLGAGVGKGVSAAVVAGGTTAALTSPLIAATAAGGTAIAAGKNLVYGKYSTSNKVTITRYTGVKGDNKEKDLAITPDRAQKIAEIVKVVIQSWKAFVSEKVEKQNEANKVSTKADFVDKVQSASYFALQKARKTFGSTWSLERTKRDLENNFATLLQDEGYQKIVKEALDNFTKVDAPTGSVMVSG
jgi:hypothetical protein